MSGNCYVSAHFFMKKTCILLFMIFILLGPCLKAQQNATGSPLVIGVA
jgi:hypothetical protein